MKKYVPFILISLLVCSCTCALYYQNHTTNSTQKVENPTSLSADSSSIDIKFPAQK